ncbi:N-acetyltransferase [Polymorphobacter multimanifer]|uniref:RimJ/RimL family protein N-acetyltransferase n=1 Tax=Polymorphobacter multimanifer TaxID=1070431 RepID=A0A841LDP7_9SPHN|nr:GNAT family N-acetyltransferase [Polymorphobacter multimanifer]MBB6227935.1 RimJ/RimL family protein N-acetyltransferase [Polymorphobacter multimanifer]GGI84929.1 N-acetyltransferase [Polymorphobacter multimanifer]
MIETERLILRNWRESDRSEAHAMGRDPAVMEYLGPLQSWADTDAMIARLQGIAGKHGHSFWAMESRDDQQFLGFCGLKIAPEDIPGIENAIEIGWRLRRSKWGQGYAREAAQATLEWGWSNLAVDRIIAITTPGNHRSQALMLRLGMVYRPDLDFDHPKLAIGDPLRPHVTYEIFRP